MRIEHEFTDASVNDPCAHGVRSSTTGIDLQRAPRRDPGRECADDADDEHRQSKRVDRGIPDAARAAAGAHEPRQREHQQQAEGRSSGHEPNRLRRDQPDDIAGARADRDPHRQLARPPRDRERQHAVDPRHRQQDADGDEREERRRRDQHLPATRVDHLVDGLHAARPWFRPRPCASRCEPSARAPPDRPPLARESASA